MKKTVVIILTLVLAASMIMFTGCKKNKKLPADKLMSEALSQTLDTMETKFAMDETRDMLKNGLFTFGIEIDVSEDSAQKIAVNMYLKNHKFAVDMNGKAIGIDLGAFKENFPKSVFGTKGDNLMNIDSESEKQIIDVVDQFVKELDLDYSDEITKFVKEHGTMGVDYSVKATVGGEEKIVNKLNVTFNKKQIEAAAKDIIKDLENSPIMSLIGVMPDEDDIEIGDEYADTDELLKLDLYTDVVSHEILGGELKITTKDYEGQTEIQTIKLDSFQTADSIRYDVDAHVDGEDHKLSALIQDNDSVKQFKLNVDNSDVFSFVADKTAKKVKVFFGGASEGLEFDYDVTRDAKGNVTYFSATLDLAKLADFMNDIERMMPSAMYADDYYLMEGGTGYAYGDDWDDDWDYDYYDDDDYGFGLFDISGKLTITYSAEGDMPQFSDLLKMSQEEIMELFSTLMSSMY